MLMEDASTLSVPVGVEGHMIQIHKSKIGDRLTPGATLVL